MADKKTLELQIKIAAENAVKVVQSLSADLKQLSQTAAEAGKNTPLKNTFSQLESEAKRAAASFKLFGQNTAELRALQQHLKTGALDLISSGLSPESDEVQNLVNQYKKLKSQADDCDRQNRTLAESFGNLKNGIGSLVAVAAAVSFDRAAAGAVNFAIESADSFQTARNDFGVMLQDMEAGAAVFDQIIKPFNDFTPFDLDTTQQAAKVLMSAKVQVKDLTTWLTRMGDLSQGSSQKMTSYVSAFSKAAAKGKADMEVLNVYIDQGVPILDALSSRFKVTSAEIVKMVSEGKVSFEDFSSTLEQMTSEGGQYYGGMELASKSYKAMQEGLSEATKSLAASFGQALLPAATKAVEVITAMVNTVNDSPILKGLLAAALAAIAVHLNAMAVKAALAFVRQMSLNLAVGALNPVVMAATVAVGVAVGALTLYASKNQEAERSVNEAALATRNAKDEVDAYAASLRNLPTGALGQVVQDNGRELARLTRQLEAAKKELAVTPARLTEVQTIKGGGTMTVDLGANARFLELNGIIEETNRQIGITKEKISAAQGQIDERAISEAMERANSVLERRNKLYGNTKEAQREQLEQELAFAQSLLTTKTRNEDGTVTGFDKAKTEAIIRDIQAKLNSLNTKKEFVLKWSDKNLSGIERIQRELEKAQKELEQKAEESFGSAYSTKNEYIKESAALEQFYAEKLADFQRREILNAHKEKMDAIAEEIEYQKEFARQQIENGGGAGAYADYAGAAATQAVSSTDIGQIALGANPLTMFADAALGAIMEIESLSKVLNFVNTILDAMIAVIEPVIDVILAPVIEFLEILGETLGTILIPVLNLFQVAIAPVVAVLNILKPVLKAVADVFKWLNNNVIVPIGNTFIDIINGIIGALNHIPFVDIDKIDRLNVIGEEAEEIADTMSQASEAIKKKYDRQIDAVQSLLDSQMDSVRSQYELGLIDRNEYEQKAAEYTDAADSKLIELNSLMAQELAQIEKNTAAGLSGEQLQAAGRQSYADTLAAEWGDSDFGVLGEIAGGVVGTVADIGSAVWNGVTNVAGAVGDFASSVADHVADFFSFDWFDVGTPNVPSDRPAIVHKGEGIIPRTFNDAIRSGEYALVGGKNSGAAASSPVYVTISVAGSVVSERQLIDVVYDGIARGISSGTYTPLPEAV